MENERSPEIEWGTPPASMERVSLWDSLHDAKLASVLVDPTGSSLQLEFDIRHLRKFHGFPEGMRFRLQFAGVQSVYVSNGSSFETSVSIAEFAYRVDAENGATDTFEADLLRGSESVALRIFLHVNGEFYPELTIRARRLNISMSSGEVLLLEDFLCLGEAYWNDFAERSGKKQE